MQCRQALRSLNLVQIQTCKLKAIEGNKHTVVFYSTLPTQEEIELLPAFPREKLSLRLLLGSGAFGEVYEGIAADILGVGSGEINVAVKVMQIYPTFLVDMLFV